MNGDDKVAVLAALKGSLRRRVYELVAAAGAGGLSRDGAALALGVPRSVAAFHLDKLVGAGFLTAEFRRPPGRGGPGAGRPAKWYRRSGGEVTLSVPDRRYALAAALFARAVERSAGEGVPVRQALCDAAREEGRRLGRRPRADGAVAPASARQRVVEVLADNGYEPQADGGLVRLRNCPFHLLAEEHRQLVCTMNHELLCGLADEVGLSPGAARLDPGPGRCCVTIAA